MRTLLIILTLTVGSVGNASEDSRWNELAALVPPSGSQIFGESVAISGDTVVVGAPYTTVNGNAYEGAAYVFVKPASGWQNIKLVATLTASDGQASYHFGNSVAISGDTIVVGARSSLEQSMQTTAKDQPTSTLNPNLAGRT